MHSTKYLMHTIGLETRRDMTKRPFQISCILVKTMHINPLICSNSNGFCTIMNGF